MQALTKPVELNDLGVPAYLDYIRKVVAPNKLAREVKLAELASNLRTADRVHCAKYLQAVAIKEKAPA